MKQKVLIANRGVVALDIINSLQSIGLEVILMYSPEDSNSLAVKLADRSYKFFSSRLEDSYLDIESIIKKAIELKVDYIHPGYGFLAENPEFARACEENNIKFIGPDSEVLEKVENKIKLREIAESLDIGVIKHSKILYSAMEFEDIEDDFIYPIIIKPLKGLGGRGIRIADFKKDASHLIDDMFKREKNRLNGLFVEEYYANSHHIEVPFFRDIKGNVLLLPEIESSVQRRFQKVFQESPSINISENIRKKIYDNSLKLIEKLNYVGFGYIEYIVDKENIYFSEINPTFQINTLISEVQVASNLIKKQFAISRGELLNKVEGIKIVEPLHHVLLVSLMAENPYKNFSPSTGIVNDFYHYSVIRNIFKTDIYTGAKISPVYDPYIGKILTFSKKRGNAIKDMRKFLDNIIIRGINTNLIFLKHLLESKELANGETIIDFLNIKCEFKKRKPEFSELEVAAALLGAYFHLENRKKNYKSRLEKLKQPGFVKRLIYKLRGE